MKNNILKTGWKHWDIYLNKFVGKKINCLELGSYKGDATCWMLNNLCTNPYSFVYSVDTWQGSPEYTDVNFEDIEKIFDANIIKTGKQKQNIKMKMTTTQALMELNIKNNVKFDFVFIDASHEAKDVMTDAILSWDLINDNGILIFDDYLWDKLNKDYFKPKIAIDSFIHIYKPQLKTLYSGYQYIIKKINKNNYEKPELEDYYKLLDEINSYSLSNVWNELNIENNDKLKYDLKLLNKPEIYINRYGNSDEFKELLKKHNNELNSKYYDYELNRLMAYYEKFDLIKSSLSENIKDEIKKYNYNPFESFEKIYLYMGKNLENTVYETISVILNNKLINIENKKKLSFLNFSHSDSHNNEFIVNYLKNKTYINNIQYYDINITLGSDSIYKTKLHNIHEIKKCINDIDNKIDIISSGLTSINLIKYNKYEYIKHYTLQFLYCIIFSLSLQKINGCSVIQFFLFLTETSIQLLWLLKKYYKKIILTKYDTSNMNSTTIKIICSNFIGISDKEINELYKIGENISKYNNKYDDFNNNYMFIHNILNKKTINNGNFNEFKLEVIKFNLQIITIINKNTLLWFNIIKYLSCDTISYNKKNNLKNIIYKKQIQNLFFWINKYKIL